MQGSIPAESDFWDGVDPNPFGDLDVSLQLSATPTGQVVARGRVVGESHHQCRRCLAEVVNPVDIDLTLVWADPDELDTEGEDPELRALDPSTNELDLAPVIREEVLLAVPRYVLCDRDCRGLCPRCGIDRNKETCECTLEEPDPRWDALRSLQNE